MGLAGNLGISRSLRGHTMTERDKIQDSAEDTTGHHYRRAARTGDTEREETTRHIVRGGDDDTEGRVVRGTDDDTEGHVVRGTDDDTEGHVVRGTDDDTEGQAIRSRTDDADRADDTSGHRWA
jgi:hypothetical protein